MAGHFTCSVCDKEHAGLVTDWAFKLPDDVWEIPEPERSEVAQFSSDFCQMDERCFIRCVLEIPFNHEGGYFGWGVWAEVEWTVLKRYWDIYDEDGSSEPPHRGTLANNLPPYPGTKGVPVTIRFRDSSKRPSLHLAGMQSPSLAIEQRQGIDGQRHHDILESLANQ